MTARQRHHASPVWDTRTPVLVPDVSAEDFDWVDFALCTETDPEAFFPAKGQPSTPAKKVCMRCEVRVSCLEYALEHGINHGIWGGMSERERRRLRARHKSEAAA